MHGFVQSLVDEKATGASWRAEIPDERSDNRNIGFTIELFFALYHCASGGELQPVYTRHERPCDLIYYSEK